MPYALSKRIPAMVYGLVCLALCAGVHGSVSVLEKDLDADKEPEVVIENEYLKVTLKPSAGGAIVGLLHKSTGKEYAPQVKGAQGMLIDLDYGQGKHADSEYPQAEYEYRIHNLGPKEAEVEIWGAGKSPPYCFVIFRKTLLVREGESIIRVSYSIENDPQSMATIELRPWLRQEVAVPEGGNLYFMPTTRGIRTLKHGAFSQSYWEYSPSRGWSGFITDGGGLVFIMDFSRLQCLHDWLGSKLATVEWRLVPLEVKQGENLKTYFNILPLKGIKALSGAGGSMAGGIDLPETAKVGDTVPLKVSLLSGRAVKDISITVRWRLLSDGLWEKLGERKVSLEPDTPVELDFGELRFSREDTYVINCAIQAEKPFDIERAVEVGKGTPDYGYPPAEMTVASSNLIQNGSFERERSLWKIQPIGSFNSTRSHGGLRSLHLKRDIPKGESTAGYQVVEPFQGGRYLLRFALLCEQAELPLIRIRVYDKEVKPQPRQYVWVRLKGRSPRWQIIKRPVTFPEGTAKIVLDIKLKGVGETWWDDFELRPLAKEERRVSAAEADIKWTMDYKTPIYPGRDPLPEAR